MLAIIVSKINLDANEIRLVNVSTGQLTFEWNRPLQCSLMHYEINATGCGLCPDYTDRNNITCEEVHINETGLRVCVISVKVLSCARNPFSEYKKGVILKG